MSNIKSFGDLGNGREPSSDEEDGGGFNDYYAGGEKSGQLIRGAPKKDEGDKDKVKSLFDKAKQAGAVQGTADDLNPAGSTGAFRGAGRTMAGAGQGDQPQAPAPINYVITFFSNGIFTINNGPPRRVDDPANKPFIDSISKGECPQELEPAVRGTPITVNLVRSQEEWKEPEKPRYTAFTGSGRTLGSSSAAPDAASGSAAASTSATASAADGEWAGVDESQPTTSLQLRLADGSRMVARFNHAHLVSDIRRFIRAARPDVAPGYTLMSGVPPTPITEEGRTLADAGLLNAVIVQRK